MLENIYDGFDTAQSVKKDLKAGRRVSVTGAAPPAREHFIREVSGDFKNRVVIAYDEKSALEVLENYLAFDKDAMYYPAGDPFMFKADIRGSYLTEKRLEAVRHIMSKEALTLVTCPEAFGDRLASRQDIENNIITVTKGDNVPITLLAGNLVSLGYEKVSTVMGPGEFAVRGGIVDVFPYGESMPYRIDLFGDEVESIRLFDAQTQRSVETVQRLTIFPGADRTENEEGSSLLEYFDPEDTLVVYLEPARMFEEKEIVEACGFAQLLLSQVLDAPAHLEPESRYEIKTKSIASYNGRFSELEADLAKYKKEKWHVTICCASQTRAERLRSELLTKELSADVVAGSVRTGFEIPDIRQALISEIDIFGRAVQKRKKKKRFEGDPISSFTDLKPGDFVVHENHGIGIYQGIEHIVSEGEEKDYMKISYAGSSNLYVLATQFDRVQKYSGSEGAKPRISKLNGKEWAATKERAAKAVEDIAAELVRLYAARQVRPGYRFSEDTLWQQEFEDSFEYEPTDDQLRAIDDIKADMESSKIMDRLICGDVGFGKTEVAIRAAFKAVQDGKQVAFLAPTTILVKQHYDTITGRMANYPVEIRMLSRFQSAAEQRETIAGMKAGRVDIIVGTHRLLSKDVGFKDLGLLIIDEEQRFGVSHKERIKQLRRDVDVLTLSATPIPRTLHMSLAGIRDMSLLTEPPVDRVAIQTYVMEYSEEAVKEALLREKARGGQTYYVYNRIDNIAMICEKIRELVPSLDVRFAHGRMKSAELEDIMSSYNAGEFDVLVSTTIIESGLDIPNVNTIIVHDADRYGLSQLYQLRGRVGRSNRTAYAFLMYRKDKVLSEVSEDRLRAIREFSDLGSGIKIAMKDLEIRGAGNVLGAQQSGHMDAVGYELYCKMLNEAVALLKGEKIRADFETSIELKADAYIPTEYIADSGEKLSMYKKISLITSQEDKDLVLEELKDRFGPVPAAVTNLLEVALLKARAHRKYITEISGSGGIYRIMMYRGARIDTYKMYDFMRGYDGALKFVAESQPYFTYIYRSKPADFKEEASILTELIESMEAIMEKDE
mgnify:CR=1 FL=1